jgi:hypothetical protein
MAVIPSQEKFSSIYPHSPPWPLFAIRIIAKIFGDSMISEEFGKVSTGFYENRSD